MRSKLWKRLYFLGFMGSILDNVLPNFDLSPKKHPGQLVRLGIL